MFPGALMAEARQTLPRVLKEWGHDCIMLEETATRYGAVETPQEGRIYAEFLAKNKGKFGGVILCLPNFGDENGAVAALRDAGVPIFIQAYPDQLTEMSPELRRDAFCGKFSIMDVFWQNGIKFTIQKPHTVSLTSERFRQNIDFFDRVCRVYNGLKRMTVGAIGARTTAFKTVRYDELALQRHGITLEAFDLSDVFARMDKISTDDAAYKEKVAALQGYSNWEGVPAQSLERIAKLGVVIDAIVEEYCLDAIAMRCWLELQQVIGVSCCVLLSEMNERGIVASCEVDVGNAVAMHALKLASDSPATCLDWNNNYGDEDDKCILFHCGPVPKSLMGTPGRITDHAILRNILPAECTYGCNVGRIAQGPFTYASMMTDSGKLKFYVGEGQFTSDPIPDDFFGCAGVAQIPNLQDVLLYIGKNGFRHHVSCSAGHVKEALVEALDNYLGFDVAAL
jgi:L-fucose isomerase-like protein